LEKANINLTLAVVITTIAIKDWNAGVGFVGVTFTIIIYIVA